MKFNKELRSFWKAPGYRYRVLTGGRASSKSHDAAGIIVFLANNYKIRVLCARQFQNKIADSMYALLKAKAEAMGIADNFDFKKNSIVNRITGSEFLFYGIARNTEEIKSLEGIDVTILEEAHNLVSSQMKILEPTLLRKNNSQIWIIFNPRFITDFVYDRYITNPPPKTLIKHINYDQNPFLSESMKEVIADKKQEDYKEYEHVYLGVPLQDSDDSIIKLSWVLASIDAHKKLGFEAEGQRIIGLDVADEGDDDNALCDRHGSVVTDLKLWSDGDTHFTAAKANEHAKKVGADEILYDSIGVGAGVKAALNRIENAVKSNGFNAGGKVAHPNREYTAGKKNKDMFSNVKAQAWWMLADRFRNTWNAINNNQKFDIDQLISLSGNIKLLDVLKKELTIVRKDYDLNGKVKVESKKDMKKRGVMSPNVADALIIAFAPSEKKVLRIDII